MQNYVVIDKKNSNNGIILEERPDPKYKVGDWIKLKSFHPYYAVYLKQ